jgi:hypothetical protein
MQGAQLLAGDDSVIEIRPALEQDFEPEHKVFDVLRDKTVRASIAELGGYDTRRAGTVGSLD